MKMPLPLFVFALLLAQCIRNSRKQTLSMQKRKTMQAQSSEALWDVARPPFFMLQLPLIVSLMHQQEEADAVE